MFSAVNRLFYLILYLAKLKGLSILFFGMPNYVPVFIQQQIIGFLNVSSNIEQIR